MTAGNVSPGKVQSMNHERDQSSNGATLVIDVAQRRGHAGKQPTRQKCGLDLETVSRDAYFLVQMSHFCSSLMMYHQHRDLTPTDGHILQSTKRQVW
jgi:hypothetical protein